MANYRIPREISSELKINKALYLTDLALLIVMLLITFMLSKIIYPPFTWFFYLFMAVVAGLLIIRPASNPKKRMYEAVYLSIIRRKDVYGSIDYENHSEGDGEDGDF